MEIKVVIQQQQSFWWSDMYCFLLTLGKKNLIYPSIVILSKIWWKTCISHNMVSTWLVTEALFENAKQTSWPPRRALPVFPWCPDLSAGPWLTFNLKLAITPTVSWAVSRHAVLCEADRVQIRVQIRKPLIRVCVFNVFGKTPSTQGSPDMTHLELQGDPRAPKWVWVCWAESIYGPYSQLSLGR